MYVFFLLRKKKAKILTNYRERGNRALVIVFSSRPFSRLRNAFKYSVLEASKLVSTKTLLLKHYDRRQGISEETDGRRRKSGICSDSVAMVFPEFFQNFIREFPAVLRVPATCSAPDLGSCAIPCPSFPWSFRKYQGKPQKHQGFFSPCEPLKTL